MWPTWTRGCSKSIISARRTWTITRVTQIWANISKFPSVRMNTIAFSRSRLMRITKTPCLAFSNWFFSTTTRTDFSILRSSKLIKTTKRLRKNLNKATIDIKQMKSWAKMWLKLTFKKYSLSKQTPSSSKLDQLRTLLRESRTRQR